MKTIYTFDRRPAAFTLIELLVVISIIVLLVSLMLPALRSAREAGRASSCLSGQRQIALSMAAYQVDSKDFFPPMHPGWVYTNAPKYYSEDDNYDWSRMLLTDGYVSTNKIYFCPSNGHMTNARKIAENDHFFNYKYVSYGYNRLHIGTSTRYKAGLSNLEALDPRLSPPARITEVRSPSRTILIGDSWRESTNEPVHFFMDKTTDVQVINPVLHNGPVIAWADGHVSRESREWLNTKVYNASYDTQGGSPLMRRFPLN